MPGPASAVLSWLMAPGIGEELPSLEDLAHRPAWMAQAQCVGLPIELFFPVRGVSAATMALARGVCAAGCPVRVECLDYARADVDTAGVWAGTTQRERRRRGSATSPARTEIYLSSVSRPAAFASALHLGQLWQNLLEASAGAIEIA